MPTHEYKIIKFSTSDEDWVYISIEEVNCSFPQEDFFFVLEDNNLILNLRQMDIIQFRSFLVTQKISEEHVLWTVLRKVEKIGSYGINGKKRLFVGFNKERKVLGRRSKEAKRERYFYTEGNNFEKENIDLPIEYIDQIVCADSEEYLKNIPGNSIDLIFTSPPYNFGLNYEGHQDAAYWQEYFDKLFAIFNECVRVLKWGGRIMVNIQPLFSDYIPSHHIISNYFMGMKMIWKGEILWEKNNYNCKYTAWGSYKSPSSPYLKYTWEFIEIFAKGDLRKGGKNELIDISADEFKDWVVARWSLAPERRMKEYGHPAMFPEALVERALKLFSYQNDIILDPFNGAGTTTAVAKRLNRHYLGIDTSQEYCDIALKRLKKIDFNPKLF